MVNGIRTSDPLGLNKGYVLKFRVGCRIQQTPEEGWRTYWLKRCEYSNKDEDNSPKTLNNKNHQALSQKFRLLISTKLVIKPWELSKILYPVKIHAYIYTYI